MVRWLGRRIVHAVAVGSLLFSGTVVILKLRTLDGRSNRFDHVTEAGTEWRFISSRDGLLVAWFYPAPRNGFVWWVEGGDGSGGPNPFRPDDGTGHYSLVDGIPTSRPEETGFAIYKGEAYVEPGPVSRVRWVRIHATHGFVAATTFLPFAVVAGAFVLRWSHAQSRERSGLCAKCGYDLRATPGRCPECGWDGKR